MREGKGVIVREPVGNPDPVREIDGDPLSESICVAVGGMLPKVEGAVDGVA